ncbi:MAG: radical SAM protein [bacterium]|nr:radical SAM protein [bacterium]
MEDKTDKIEMEYPLMVAVWEITMNCNMRCKHCGSSCAGPLPDELTTEEALDLCDALGRMGMTRITLSGGEPFSRPDWPLLVERLTKNNIKTNLLSNGWMLDRDTIRKALKAGAVNLGISLDGLEETHDFIRKKGSFARIMKALDIMKEEGMPGGIVTCIHKKNIDELPGMKDLLVEKGVYNWQLQGAVPMGNLLNYPDWILDQKGVDDIIDYGHDFMTEGKIRVDLADDIGYYNIKEVEVRQLASNDPDYPGLWTGCPAGKTVVGIRCTGDIIGCLSIRDDSYIEANVRDIPLEEIWTRPGAFAWNRELSKEKLSGFCHTCQYGCDCLGGCAGTKLIRFNSISENKFCSYRCAVLKEKEEISKIDDLSVLVEKGYRMVEDEEFQLAELYISRALESQPDDIKLLNMLGFIHFNLENYNQCETANRKVLELDPNNAYALKGLGLCLCNLAQVEDGIKLLQQSIQHATDDFLDPFFDLALILGEVGRKEEGIKVLEEGRRRSEAFKAESEELYQSLQSE